MLGTLERKPPRKLALVVGNAYGRTRGREGEATRLLGHECEHAAHTSLC